MGARTTVALGLALLFTGAAFDAPSLYVPGVALLVLALLAALWVGLAARGVRVERLAGPATVVEGEPYPLRIRLTQGPVPPHGELVDPLLGDPLRVGFGLERADGVSKLRPRELVLERGTAFARRGRRQLEPPRLVIRDPLAIRSREVEGGGAADVLILPRCEPVVVAGHLAGEDGDPFAGLGEGAGAGLRATLDVEVDGIRPYRTGSPASRIHWPAVARHGELIERRLISGGDGTALVVLDSERPDSEQALDRAVRAAASLCVALARSGGCSLIVGGEGRQLRVDPQLHGWPQAHARLALVEAGVSLAAQPLGAGGAGFWVTAERSGAPSRALGRSDAAAWFLVTPFTEPGAPAAFSVAGCEGRLLRATRAAAARIARSAA